jgi:hypothetical protein
VLFESSIKLRLSALSYWYQRFKIRWKNRKTLLIRGFLLELPLQFRIVPHPPAYEARPRSRMLHTNDTISILEQILHTMNVESRKVVRRYRRLGNPKISQPRHTTLPFCENGSYSTQGMRRNSTASVAVRWIPSSSAVSFLDQPRVAAMLVTVMRSNAQPNQRGCKKSRIKISVAPLFGHPMFGYTWIV